MKNAIKVFVPICYNIDYDEGGIALYCFGIADNGKKIELAEHFAEFKPGEYEQQTDESRQVRIKASAYKREMSRLKRVNNRNNEKKMIEKIEHVVIDVLTENPHF